MGSKLPRVALQPIVVFIFNACPNMGGNYNLPYSTLVHEAGHALGVRAASEIAADSRLQGHPSITDSIMNYSSVTGVVEPDCSPHPLDIMAIYAIYQTGR